MKAPVLCFDCMGCEVLKAESVKSQSFPAILAVFAAVTAVLGCLTLVAESICVHYLHLDRIPYNGMTLGPALNYADMAMFSARFDHFHTASFFSPVWGSDFLYPAPIALLYRFFHFFPDDTNFFLAFVALTFVCLAIWFFIELRARGLGKKATAVFVTASLVFSYPFYFEFNRANMEILVWGFSALGILLLFRHRPWLAAACIGMAGACKGYPFFYLGLFLVRKKYRQAIFSMLLGVTINFVSLWAVAGNYAMGQHGTALGLAEFQSMYVLRRRANEIGLDHSIFGFIKRFWRDLPLPDALQHYLLVYLSVAGAIAGAVFLLRVRKLPAINQLLFLTTACLTLPPTSYDYTLLHLYTPWALLTFLAAETWLGKKPMPRGLWPVYVCFMVLLSPQNEIIWNGERLDGQIKCVVLLVLAALSAWTPLEYEPYNLAAHESTRADRCCLI